MTVTQVWLDGIVDPHIHLWDPLTTEREVSEMARLFTEADLGLLLRGVARRVYRV